MDSHGLLRARGCRHQKQKDTSLALHRISFNSSTGLSPCFRRKFNWKFNKKPAFSESSSESAPFFSKFFDQLELLELSELSELLLEDDLGRRFLENYGKPMGLSGNFTGKTDGLEGCLTRKPVFDRFSDRKLRKENFSGWKHVIYSKFCLEYPYFIAPTLQLT